MGVGTYINSAAQRIQLKNIKEHLNLNKIAVEEFGSSKHDLEKEINLFIEMTIYNISPDSSKTMQ